MKRLRRESRFAGKVGVAEYRSAEGSGSAVNGLQKTRLRLTDWHIWRNPI